MSPSLAIVVPAGPGDEAWRELLPQLDLAGAQEVALVLTRSDADADADVVEDLLPNVTLVHSTAGRARQLNTGAAATSADWLWFLHADSRVAVTALDALHRFVRTDKEAIGYFDLRFLDDGPRLMALNTIGAHLRSRWLGLPFGDQGFLMPRRVFDAVGGFDEHLIGGEDHALVWMARSLDIPLRPVRAPLHTSARKYARYGWWAITREHLRLTVAQARMFSRLTTP